MHAIEYLVPMCIYRQMYTKMSKHIPYTDTCARKCIDCLQMCSSFQPPAPNHI